MNINEHINDSITNVLYGLIYFNIRKYNFIYKIPSPYLIILCGFVAKLIIVDPLELRFILSSKISIPGNVFSISDILFNEGLFFLFTLVVIIGLFNVLTTSVTFSFTTLHHILFRQHA